MSNRETQFFLALRDSLGLLEAETRGFIARQGNGPVAGSRAANEKHTFPRSESIVTVWGIGDLLIEHVGEHVSVLTKVMTEPIEPTACWTVVRSLLESAALAVWLLDPQIDAGLRVRRAFAHRFDGVREQAKFGRAIGASEEEQAKYDGLLDKLADDAALLCIKAIRDKNGKLTGIGLRMPSATELIRDVLNEEAAYRLLSAFAHGHYWPRLSLHYKAVQNQPESNPIWSDATPMEKTLGTVSGYSYLVVRAVKCLCMALWTKTLYYGWDRVQLAESFERVHDYFHAADALRFWRR